MSAALIETALAALRPRIGETLGPSDWVSVDQAMIDAFAALTNDRQFIHVEPQAARATAFGSTVAHGFLTLSLLSQMAYALLPAVPGRTMGVNYGFDRIRFIAPVRSGARVRAAFRMTAADARPPDGVMLRLAVMLEIEGDAKPALTADWLTLSLLA